MGKAFLLDTICTPILPVWIFRLLLKKYPQQNFFNSTFLLKKYCFTEGVAKCLVSINVEIIIKPYRDSNSQYAILY